MYLHASTLLTQTTCFELSLLSALEVTQAGRKTSFVPTFQHCWPFMLMGSLLKLPLCRSRSHDSESRMLS